MSKKLVLILQFYEAEGPGYLADFLIQNAIQYQLVKIDQMENVPESISDYAGIVLMGGPMSVNDNLPWIDKVIMLIQQAMRFNVPVLGHCLGGQLMSKALGAIVKKNTRKEIGWFSVKTQRNNSQEIQESQKWFNDLSEFDVFHWHGETFELPENAVHLLSNQNCYHQAYCYLEKHIAFQCHIEMTPLMVKDWVRDGMAEIENERNKESIQMPEVILDNLSTRCDRLNQLACRVYELWIKGLRSH
ncbi:MAG: type 1 glutamine amidotransferase [Candidatus Methylopumilus sp.]|nr:type 1 glutamine amidotransferase [Candidatus Methylopumilus sp.]